jgi:uncharacterized glyoxalase superfamily protein PhnB
MKKLEFRFAFHAYDFDQSVQFYRDILGMTHTGGWDRPDGKGALLAATNEAVVEIFGVAEGKRYEGPSPVAVNLAIRLESADAVDGFYQLLVNKNVKIQGPPEDRAWGHRSFIVVDPDGIPIHYYSELE